MQLQESWREGGNQFSNFSTLFCPECAIRVSQAYGLALAPIQLTAFDNLNLGVRQTSFEVSEADRKELGIPDVKNMPNPATKWGNLFKKD